MRFGGKWFASAILLAGVALAAACSDDDDDDATPVPTNTAVATQEQQGQNTAVVPGVTRGTETAVPTATPTPIPDEPPAVSLTDALPGLPTFERPIELLSLEFQGATWWFAVQQNGIVYRWVDGAEANATVVLDISAQVQREGNEEGLLGMAFDPEVLGERPYAYAYYSVAPGERRTRLSRFNVSLPADAPIIDAATELVILEQPQPFANHNGGKIAFGPDGFLYVGLGDGGSGGDPQGNGQNPNTLLGTILRIDVSNSSADLPYSVPANNPFAGVDTGRNEVWAYGLRNPWRFSFDADGRLWAGDVGQGQWEEIDLIEGGKNYGWAEMEGPDCFGDSCDPSLYTLPVAYYSHDFGCSVTGGVVHEGPGALSGWYVFADFCSGIVFTFHSDGELPVEGMPAVLIESGLNIASFVDDPEGEGIYALAFDGRIYYLAPS